MLVWGGENHPDREHKCKGSRWMGLRSRKDARVVKAKCEWEVGEEGACRKTKAAVESRSCRIISGSATNK